MVNNMNLQKAVVEQVWVASSTSELKRSESQTELESAAENAWSEFR